MISYLIATKWNFENSEYFLTLSTFNNYMYKYLNKNFKMTLNLAFRDFFNVTASAQKSI